MLQIPPFYSDACIGAPQQPTTKNEASVQRGDDWVNTKRFTNSSGNTTRVTRGDDGSMISRRGQDGRGFVGTKGDSVYAGRDGNVYRRDGSGNWSKWENGSWNPASRPEQRGDSVRDRGNDSVRDSMLNDRGRQNERTQRADGERASQRSSGASQMDRGTLNSLERDRAARSAGSQRSRDFGSYSRSRSSGSVGGYGGSRGGGGRGGGGFRGGGRRR